MRSGKLNYFVVGLFVLTMLVGLIASVAVLTGRTGTTDSYFAYYRNVTGIKFGTQVLYEGYPVGQVEKVTPETAKGAMRFKVDFTVTQGWRIPSDSVARVAAPGLLSAITISIGAGKSTTALPPGAEVKGLEQSDVFSVVTNVAGQLGELTEGTVKPLLSHVERAVLSFAEFMDKDARGLTREVSLLTQDLSLRVPRIAGDLEVVTDNLIAATEQIETLFAPENRANLERQLGAIIDKLDSASTDFATLGRDLQATRQTTDELLVAMDQTVGDMSTMIADNRLDLERSVIDLRYVLDSVARNIDGLNHNLEGAARNMHEFARQIRQNPGLLLGGTPPEDNAPGR